MLKFWSELSRRERLLVSVTLLACGIVLGVVTGRLWGLPLDWGIVTALFSFLGVAVTAWIAWKSYQASQVSADVAKTALSANRAWLIPEPITASYYPNGMGDEPIMDIVYFNLPILNCGASPALGLIIDAKYQITRADDEGEPGSVRPIIYDTHAALGPGQTFTSGARLVEDDVRRVLAGKANLRVDFKVIFKDVLIGETHGFTASYHLLVQAGGPLINTAYFEILESAIF